MKTLRLIPAVLAATLAFGTAASAEEFNGPSVGVQAGWNKNVVNDPRTDLGIAEINQSRNSFIAGGFAGYGIRSADYPQCARFLSHGILDCFGL